MTEQLNYISLAINQIRRATGTRAAPGETCEHIRITNPDRELKNGTFSAGLSKAMTAVEIKVNVV